MLPAQLCVKCHGWWKSPEVTLVNLWEVQGIQGGVVLLIRGVRSGRKRDSPAAQVEVHPRTIVGVGVRSDVVVSSCC